MGISSRKKKPSGSELKSGAGKRRTARAEGDIHAFDSHDSRPLQIELEQETDGRWLAAIEELPGTMAYGTTRAEASIAAEKLALRVLLDRLEHGEDVPQLANLFLVVA